MNIMIIMPIVAVFCIAISTIIRNHTNETKILIEAAFSESLFLFFFMKHSFKILTYTNDTSKVLLKVLATNYVLGMLIGYMILKEQYPQFLNKNVSVKTSSLLPVFFVAILVLQLYLAFIGTETTSS